MAFENTITEYDMDANSQQFVQGQRGDASDFEKFEKWAETVPYTLRNPLYHWTHLELRRYFGIEELLNPSTAKKIYDNASSKLNSNSPRSSSDGRFPRSH